jgi:hypothetical protein
MSSFGNDAFTLVWILGCAVMVVALFTLLGKRPGRGSGAPRRES